MSTVGEEKRVGHMPQLKGKQKKRAYILKRGF